MLLPVTRNLAQRLLAYEAGEGESSEPTELAFFRVYEKLRRHLCALAGIAGFQSLASRALTLARSEAPTLSAAHITADGCLQGIGELDPRLNDHETGEWEVILVAQLLGLLVTFIGEALTLQLVRDVWPETASDDSDSEIRRNA
jgi:hypothetical protein